MKRNGFTLVELLVVIGIIALLVAVLTGLFAGSTEAARAVKCMANMRNLAVIASTVEAQTDPVNRGTMLNAGSKDGKIKITTSGPELHERRGWLSWDSRGVGASGSTSMASQGMLVSAYTKDFEQRMFCYTNGTFYSVAQGNIDIFKCPTHLVKMKKENPAWSYVMNANIGNGWASTIVNKAPPACKGSKERHLLLAELPFLGTEGDTPDTSESAGFQNDCTLQFDGCGTTAEYIGFNHRTSRHMTCAHVVFCDTHVEKLLWPAGKGLSKSEVVELTKWLCTGKSISFNGKRYEEVK